MSRLVLQDVQLVVPDVELAHFQNVSRPLPGEIGQIHCVAQHLRAGGEHCIPHVRFGIVIPRRFLVFSHASTRVVALGTAP